jgi:hypothetical protein
MKEQLELIKALLEAEEKKLLKDAKPNKDYKEYEENYFKRSAISATIHGINRLLKINF